MILWVETTFDTDGDGKLDRMHVDVTRPKQTETEGLKLPVVYESSPYYAGTAAFAEWLILGCKTRAWSNTKTKNSCRSSTEEAKDPSFQILKLKRGYQEVIL